MHSALKVNSICAAMRCWQTLVRPVSHWSLAIGHRQAWPAPASPSCLQKFCHVHLHLDHSQQLIAADSSGSCLPHYTSHSRLCASTCHLVLPYNAASVATCAGSTKVALYPGQALNHSDATAFCKLALGPNAGLAPGNPKVLIRASDMVKHADVSTLVM